MFGSLLPTGMVWAEEPLGLPEIQARSYLLLEIESGRVLAEQNLDQAYAPASMTKMMTGYLILKEIKDNRLSWDDEVTVSNRAASVGGAGVDLKAGEKRTVKELFHALAIESANDATVALAEHAAGDEAEFVRLMNRTAENMGLKQTHFHNSTGLPPYLYTDPPQVSGPHEMSAMDLAMLSRRLIYDFPEEREMFSNPRYTFRKGEPGAIRLTSTNRMLPGLSHHYEGLDGVKTGFTSKAGYCFTGSAERNGMRFITVVMGTSSDNRRFKETKKLLDYGFENVEIRDFAKKGEAISGVEKVPVAKGMELEAALAADGYFRYPVRKGEEERFEVKVVLEEELEAPLAAGTVVGEAKFLHDGEEVSGVEPVPVVTVEDVERAGWLRLLWRTVSGWFTGNAAVIVGELPKAAPLYTIT